MSASFTNQVLAQLELHARRGGVREQGLHAAEAPRREGRPAAPRQARREAHRAHPRRRPSTSACRSTARTSPTTTATKPITRTGRQGTCPAGPFVVVRAVPRPSLTSRAGALPATSRDRRGTGRTRPSRPACCGSCGSGRARPGRTSCTPASLPHSSNAMLSLSFAYGAITVHSVSFSTAVLQRRDLVGRHVRAVLDHMPACSRLCTRLRCATSVSYWPQTAQTGSCGPWVGGSESQLGGSGSVAAMCSPPLSIGNSLHRARAGLDPARTRPRSRHRRRRRPIIGDEADRRSRSRPPRPARRHRSGAAATAAAAPWTSASTRPCRRRRYSPASRGRPVRSPRLLLLRRICHRIQPSRCSPI